MISVVNWCRSLNFSIGKYEVLFGDKGCLFVKLNNMEINISKM